MIDCLAAYQINTHPDRFIREETQGRSMTERFLMKTGRFSPSV